MKNIEKIATHNGIFHHDDVFAAAALKMAYPNADLRFDVGDAYNHETRDYDHHQTNGAGERENGIPYSSFGLIWKHYATQIPGVSEEIAQRVDKNLVQRVDGVDTNHFEFNQSEGPAYVFQEISKLNPSWYEKNQDADTNFEKAVGVATIFLESSIRQAQGEALIDKEIENAVKNSNGHSDYLVFDRYFPWHEFVISQTGAKYVIFPNTQGMYMVQAVPEQVGQRGGLRKDLPATWAGLKNKALEEKTGIQGATFCHNKRFIAGATTLEAAKEMAELALKSKE